MSDSVKVKRTDDGRWMFFCPGCNEAHGPNDSWTYNGNAEIPTFSPSILVRGTKWLTDEQQKMVMRGESVEPTKTVCHSFVRDGKIEFLSDCTHELAGQTVEIPSWGDV